MMERVERAATVNGARVNLIIEWDGAYVAWATGAGGARIATLPALPGPYFPAEVARLQRAILDRARAALGDAGRSLQDIADEMQRNGELATARSLHRSLRRRR